MSIKEYPLWAVIYLLISLTSCAKQGAPTGGAKDIKPPGIDSTHSSRNYTTRFSDNTIRLTFDEWVTLSDVSTQVLVSPPLVTKPVPQVTLKGKTVTVEFPEGEVLRPNTTYTLNFGTAIKDLHEGNPAPNLRYVFSTGDFIDSLQVTGVVRDAFTNEPVENITVMLYDLMEDSIIRKQKPYYFARTDKAGQYLIENIRTGQYKMAAVEDISNNLKWEEGNERLAFQDSSVQITDTLTKVKFLRLFKGKTLARRTDADAKRYGLVRLRYNTLPDTLPIRTSAPEGLRLIQERSLDTMLIWYDLPVAAAWELYAGRDTVKVKLLDKSAFTAQHKLRFADDAPIASVGKFGKNNRLNPTENSEPAKKETKIPAKVIQQNPGKNTFFDFNTPVAAIDTSKWRFETDSVPNRNFTVQPDTLHPRRLRFQHNWKPSSDGLLTLLPGAITDMYGVANVDTLQRAFTILGTKQLGGLNLTLNSLKPGTYYILKLLEGETVEEERRFVATGAENRLVFANLRTTTYTLQLTEDRNNNGLWDSGDYYKHLQPEPIYTRKLEALRPNWEIESTVEATYNISQKKFKK